jgi:hypothetical protein
METPESKAAQKFDFILDDIENGHANTKACQNNDLHHSTFYRYLRENKEASDRYARACEIRAELKFESIEQDYNEEPQRDPETGKIDTGWVQLQKLKIDAKKWELAKLLPKKYGDNRSIDLTAKAEHLIFEPLDLDVRE